MDTEPDGGEATKTGHEFAPGVRLNRHQVPVLDTFISPVPRDKGQAMPNVIGGSLNAKQRQKQYEQTCKQNLTLFEGIKKQTSHYKVKAMKSEWRQTEKYRSNIRRNLTAGFLKKPDESSTGAASEGNRLRPRTSGMHIPMGNNKQQPNNNEFMRSSGPQYFGVGSPVSPLPVRPNTSASGAGARVLTPGTGSMGR